MSVFHCGMFEIMLVNNVCIVWSLFSSQNRDRASCFRLLFLYIDSDWFSSLLLVTALYPLLLPLWQLSFLLLKSSLWWPLWWNLHSPPKRDCLHIEMILCHLWYQKNHLDSGFRPWCLRMERGAVWWSGRKMWIVFLASLFQKNIERIATGIRCIRCPGALGPYKRLSMCHWLITLAARRTENQPQTHGL